MKSEHLLQISLVAAVINIALTPIASDVAAYFGYLTIICSWAYALMRTVLSRSIKLSVLVLFIIVVLSLITSGTYFSGEELRKKIINIISFISFYWMLSLPKDTDISHRINFKHIYYSAIALSIVFGIYAFAFPSISYTPSGKYGRLLFTMGMGNPNGTAVYVLFAAMILLLAISLTRNKFKKAILCVAVAALVYIILLLRARTVLACFILAVLCVIFLPLLKCRRIFRYIVLVAPIIMIVIQFALNDKIGNLELLGENLDTGRYAMYRDLLEQIGNEPLQYIFGNLCKYNFQNFHNGVLTIFSSLGIIGIVWTIWMWNICLRNIEKTSKSKYQKLAYFFVLLFLLDSVSESMTMVGTIPQGLFVYLMVKIARGEVVLNSTDLNSEPESFAQERKLYDRTSTD